MKLRVGSTIYLGSHRTQRVEQPEQQKGNCLNQVTEIDISPWHVSMQLLHCWICSRASIETTICHMKKVLFLNQDLHAGPWFEAHSMHSLQKHGGELWKDHHDMHLKNTVAMYVFVELLAFLSPRTNTMVSVTSNSACFKIPRNSNKTPKCFLSEQCKKTCTIEKSAQFEGIRRKKTDSNFLGTTVRIQLYLYTCAMRLNQTSSHRVLFLPYDTTEFCWMIWQLWDQSTLDGVSSVQGLETKGVLLKVNGNPNFLWEKYIWWPCRKKWNSKTLFEDHLSNTKASSVRHFPPLCFLWTCVLSLYPVEKQSRWNCKSQECNKMFQTCFNTSDSHLVSKRPEVWKELFKQALEKYLWIQDSCCGSRIYRDCVRRLFFKVTQCRQRGSRSPEAPGPQSQESILRLVHVRHKCSQLGILRAHFLVAGRLETWPHVQNWRLRKTRTKPTFVKSRNSGSGKNSSFVQYFSRLPGGAYINVLEFPSSNLLVLGWPLQSSGNLRSALKLLGVQM